MDGFAHARHLARTYRWLLENPRPDLFSRAFAMLAKFGSPRFRGGFNAPSAFAWEPGTPPSGHDLPSSISGLARAIVLLGVDASRLDDALAEPPWRHASCLSRSCQAPAEWIRSNGTRGGTWETYCALCGSRFLGDRIILSFDYGHGDPRLKRRSVQKARSRLVRWRMAAFQAGQEARDWPASRPRTVTRILAAAGIPLQGYLRAKRLGITEAGRSGLLDLPSPAEWGTGGGRWRHPRVLGDVPLIPATRAPRTRAKASR